MAEQTVEITPTSPNVRSSVRTDDGFTVESNFETPAQLRKGLGLEEIAEAAEITEPAAAEVVPARKPNRRNDPRIAVETAVGKQREAERLATDAAEKAAKLEARIAELEKPKPAPVVAAAPVAQPAVAAQPAAEPVARAAYARYMAMPDAPKIADYKTIEEYQFDVAEFVADTRFAENMQRASQMNAAQQAHAQFTQRLTEAKTRIPDFDQRFNPNTPIDTRVFPYVQRLENAPDVMLYLSDHQDIAQRLTTLHPVDQIGQIGEIAGTLKTQSAAAPSPASARPAISQAKPPTKRVSGAPPAATDEPPGDDASEAEYEAYWGPRRAESHAPRRRHR